MSAIANLDQVMQGAIGCHQGGRLAEAETLYRDILAREPNHLPALHMLGVLAAQSKRPDAAVALLQRALAMHPGAADVHSDLGNALRGMGKLQEAAAACREAVRLRPDHPAALNNLGVILCEMGNTQAAVKACHEAARLKPDYVDAYINLGNALLKDGQIDAAIDAYQRALQFDPRSFQAFYGLGCALLGSGRSDQAVDAFDSALKLDPQNARTHTNLGSALLDCGRIEAAIAEHREAIRIDPRLADAYNNLGCALSKSSRLDEAVSAFHAALELEPGNAKVMSNLAWAQATCGRLDETVELHRAAIRAEPGLAAIGSNLLYLLQFHPNYDAPALLAESRRWADRHASPHTARARPHENDPTSGRRLRIGYVSPDFRHHVIGQNLLPLMRHADHERYEIFCYANLFKTDAITEEIRGCTDQWREIACVSDDRAAEMIRQDRIDILVDLTLHMASNRMGVLARKPAPVQVAYLASYSTTGVEAIDYRLSDPYIDPEDSDLSCYSEKTIRLPHCTWCYEPSGPTPEIAPLPALARGQITFGSRNSPLKVSTAVLELWARIVLAVPGSRLLLTAPTGSARAAIYDVVARAGLSKERVEFLYQEPWDEFIRSYDSIDIALDPFPYNGWITTCDALWMGAPVVTLSGATAPGRGGRSILMNLGLPELVAETREQYLEIAVGLANDLPRLSEMRAGLRERLRRSPMGDAKGVARELEAAYRQMWLEWIHSRKGQ